MILTFRKVRASIFDISGCESTLPVLFILTPTSPLLSITNIPEPRPTNPSIHSSIYSFYYYSPIVGVIAKKYGQTPEQIFFRFVKSLGITPLTGTTTVTHMVQDIAAVQDNDLAEDEVQRIRKALLW